ncbi:MAG: hypothetical protein ACREO1_06655 [Arenimonas sp.]
MKHRSISQFSAATFLIYGSLAGNQIAVAGSDSASPQLEDKLKNGMAYQELREIVIANGWVPLVTPECKENVGGEAKICDQRPEVEACSGDGHCNMQFSHTSDRTKLRVGTYGDYVKFWGFSPIGNSNQVISNDGKESIPWSNTLPADACTLNGYWSFFEAFVRSETIQKSHTSQQVELRNYKTNEKIKARYDRFKIGLVDYSWSYIEINKHFSDYVRLDLKKTTNGNTFRVDYQKAEYGPDDELLRTYGNPGAYVFELKEACWQLTKEFR